MPKIPRHPQQRSLFEPEGGSEPPAMPAAVASPQAARPKPSAKKAPSIGPAPVSPELATIATALPDVLRLGTSSWTFPGWSGIVYDRHGSMTELSRDGLAAYARHPLFRTVGIDRTYYAPVTADVLAAYAAAVPDHFQFLVKAASLVTDPVIRGERGVPERANERFLDVEFAAEFCVQPFVEGLGDKGSVLLFQFPPLGRDLVRRTGEFADRLARFLEALPAGPRYAVEMRDREILGPEYAAALTAGRAVHCITLHPRMPKVEDQRQYVDAEGSGPLVIRWMLHSGFAFEEARDQYAPFDRLVDEDLESRASVVSLILENLRLRRPVTFIANNKAEGSAPLTVFKLAHAIAAGLP